MKFALVASTAITIACIATLLLSINAIHVLQVGSIQLIVTHGNVGTPVTMIARGNFTIFSNVSGTASIYLDLLGMCTFRSSTVVTMTSPSSTTFTYITTKTLYPGSVTSTTITLTNLPTVVKLAITYVFTPTTTMACTISALGSIWESPSVWYVYDGTTTIGIGLSVPRTTTLSTTTTSSTPTTSSSTPSGTVSVATQTYAPYLLLLLALCIMIIAISLRRAVRKVMSSY